MASPFHAVRHLCTVVHDIEKSVGYYTGLGIGPWAEFGSPTSPHDLTASMPSPAAKLLPANSPANCLVAPGDSPTSTARPKRPSGPPAPTSPRTLPSPSGARSRTPKPLIVNRHGHLNPIGVPGELLIGGAGVARGYLNRPEITAERITHHHNKRLHHTDDIARWLPNCDIDYLGRADHQVKIRGHRIELGEIEAILNRHPHITTGIVTAREDTPGDKRLTAYYVAANPIPDLCETCRQTLPDYMIPATFTRLDNLPRTPNSKTDRKALRPPTRPDPTSHYTPPRNHTEQALATIWATSLGIEHIGIHDNFFELGGDSILGVQALLRAKRFGIHLTAPQLFQFPTLNQLAAQVPAEPSDNGEAPVQGPHGGPLTFRLLRTSGLNAEALQSAPRALTRHHDTLRSPADGLEAEPRIRQFDALITAESLRAAARALREDLDWPTGRVLGAALLGHGSRLLLVSYEGAMDERSWNILLDHLDIVMTTANAHRQILLTLRTATWRQCAEELGAERRDGLPPAGGNRSAMTLEFTRDAHWSVPVAPERVAAALMVALSAAGYSGSMITVNCSLRATPGLRTECSRTLGPFPGRAELPLPAPGTAFETVVMVVLDRLSKARNNGTESNSSAARGIVVVPFTDARPDLGSEAPSAELTEVHAALGDSGPYDLDVIARLDGTRLLVRVIYDLGRWPSPSIEAFGDAIDDCLQSAGRPPTQSQEAPTPAEFPRVALDQARFGIDPRKIRQVTIRRRLEAQRCVSAW